MLARIIVIRLTCKLLVNFVLIEQMLLDLDSWFTFINDSFPKVLYEEGKKHSNRSTWFLSFILTSISFKSLIIEENSAMWDLIGVPSCMWRRKRRYFRINRFTDFFRYWSWNRSHKRMLFSPQKTHLIFRPPRKLIQ